MIKGSVFCGAGNDLVNSASGTIKGGVLLVAGDDTFAGGVGAEFINGGLGQDTMSGGAGADKFFLQDRRR